MERVFRNRRSLQRHAPYGHLIVDELGYAPSSKKSREIFFRGFADWTRVFEDIIENLLEFQAHWIHTSTAIEGHTVTWGETAIALSE